MAILNNSTLENYFKIIANNVRRLSNVTNQLTLKQMHDNLLNVSGLSRNNVASTPGDYLKGIAVCARYLNQRSDYLTATNTLYEISQLMTTASVGGSEEPEPMIRIYLNENFVLSVEGNIESPDPEVAVALYRLEGDNHLQISGDGAFPKNNFPYYFDTSELESGTYYATVTLRNYDDEYLFFESNKVNYVSSGGGGGTVDLGEWTVYGVTSDSALKIILDDSEFKGNVTAMRATLFLYGSSSDATVEGGKLVAYLYPGDAGIYDVLVEITYSFAGIAGETANNHFQIPFNPDVGGGDGPGTEEPDGPSYVMKESTWFSVVFYKSKKVSIESRNGDIVRVELSFISGSSVQFTDVIHDFDAYETVTVDYGGEAISGNCYLRVIGYDSNGIEVDRVTTDYINLG